MQTVKKRVNELLKNPPSGVAGSIYIPPHPSSSSPNVTADRTRFKNALQYIKKHDNYEHAQLDDSLKKLEVLYEDMEFWKYQDQGLSVLFNADSVEYFKLPFEVTEAHYLTNHFVVSPLLILEAIDTTFYVLDVNVTQPRLFRGTRGQLEEVNKNNMPGTLEDEVGKDEYKKELQHRSSGVGAFHGHTENDVVNDEVRRYVKILTDVVDRFMSDSQAPLLIAGTDNRVEVVKKELQYAQIVEQSYVGSVEYLSGAELYKKVSEHLLHYLQNVRQTAVKKLQEAPPKLVANSSEEILKVTKSQTNGRVEALYLPVYRLTKDTVQPGDNTAFIVELPENIAPLESLVKAVIGQGGEIIPVEIDAYEKLSGPKALCRY